MPQLDLFSPAVEKEAVDKKPAVKSPDVDGNSSAKLEGDEVKSGVALAEETLLHRRLAMVREEEMQKKEEPSPVIHKTIVFSDENITVKIKEKKIVPEPDVVAIAPSAKATRTPQKRGRKSLKEVDTEADLIEIPEDEELFKKQYYPISVVAQWFRVNTSLLRFWENEFDILKPKKNRKGDRLFRPEDVKNLQLIYHLLRQRKYSIEGAKEFLKGDKKKADMELQLTLTLQKFRSFLLELKANLQS